MPAEKQNNISGKLDALRSLPEGYSFRPDTVWNRLEPKLKKGAINYRAVFFAAASFLAVIIFIALPAKRNDQAGIADTKPKSVVPNKAIIENITTGSSNMATSSEDESFKNTLTRKSIAPVRKKSGVKEELVVITPAIPSHKPEEVPAPELRSETQAAVAVAPAKPKRRFPIAHANELNQPVPVEEEPVVRSKTSFAFRKHTYEVPLPVTGFEEGFTERKKQKTIFPLLNSSQ
jgi:hypothetical protein